MTIRRWRDRASARGMHQGGGTERQQAARHALEFGDDLAARAQQRDVAQRRSAGFGQRRGAIGTARVDEGRAQRRVAVERGGEVGGDLAGAALCEV